LNIERVRRFKETMVFDDVGVLQLVIIGAIHADSSTDQFPSLLALPVVVYHYNFDFRLWYIGQMNLFHG